MELLKGSFLTKRKQKALQSKSTEIAKGFIIDTERVNKITSQETISWTFRLEKTLLESSDFENFLVKKYKGEFTYYLISYIRTENNDFELFEKVTSYKIPKNYLDLSALNLMSRDDSFDWANPNDGSGTNDECEGIVTTETTPCNQGGVHAVKYCCQHTKGEHGCGDFPKCGWTCTGTGTRTVTDFSHCESGTYTPPSGGASNGANTGDTTSGSTGGTYGGSTGGDTLTSPDGISHSENPCDTPPMGDINGDCMLQYYEACLVGVDLRGLSTEQLKEFEYFIDSESCSNEVKEFVKLAVETLVLGEVDTFEEYRRTKVPPSCESFNFMNITTNWQEAAVKNIKFHVYLINDKNIKYSYSVLFSQPVLFGMPSNLSSGGPISNGLAAEISADVLNVTIRETLSTFRGKFVNTTDIDLYFKERLKYNYKIYIPGGRIQFNSGTTLVATEYKTNLIGTGNCN